MKVSVVGAGKMGLPVACQIAGNGASVLACDINPATVDAINAGSAPVEEPGLAERLAAVTRCGRLLATTDTVSAVADSEVVIVLVPALLTPERRADLSNLLAASTAIAHGLRTSSMVIYETTVPVGATRTRLGPALATTGLTPGLDFDLVFSPERVKSRHVFRNLTVNPKVVGGLTPQAAQRGVTFYEQYLAAPVLNVGSLEAAEFVKLAGMVYRDVNIGLANQLAEYAESIGVDFSALISAINSDGEAALLAPGIGVGGHCTPVYPYFYLQDADERGVDAAMARQARQINDDQSRRALDRVEARWRSLRGEGALLLGLAFRPQVQEDAFSPTYLLRDHLARLGANPVVHDPLYSEAEIRKRGFEPANLTADILPPVVVLVTAHAEYWEISFEDLARRGVQVVVDGRNVWDAASVRSAGLLYISVGQPDEDLDETGYQGLVPEFTAGSLTE